MLRMILSGSSVVILGLAVAGIGHAGSGAPDSTPTSGDAEFARYMEKTLAAKPAVQPPAKAAVSCEGGQKRAEAFTKLKSVELELARLRKQQEAKWAEKGWTAKEAAAAGEPVVLNGSGYNIKNSIGR
ncbi:MAG: hypothetical protein GY944_17795 [bacterium]|nr:hypothetical protein [bacterium]MCP5042881.1 hypothetical protein [bacterium]